MTVKPNVLDASSILVERPSQLPATVENIALAKAFVFQQWIDRAEERGMDKPSDLSYGCKFASLFVWHVFGGKLAGNYDHQFNVINNLIVDLSFDSSDVKNLSSPYRHDPVFFGCPDHIESLNSCMQRVDRWIELFNKEMQAGQLQQPAVRTNKPCRP